jgi:hypothetical protein
VEEEAVEEVGGLRRRSLTANCVLLRLARDQNLESIYPMWVRIPRCFFPPFWPRRDSIKTSHNHLWTCRGHGLN